VLKITIITVSYNAVATIEQTISSVVHQDYPHIEYIIVDGGSTDGTVDIIKKYESHGIRWISEPDHGIYDAMNKGVQMASGDYIYFLGADDWLCSSEVMRAVSDVIHVHAGFSFYMGNVLLYQNIYRLIQRKRVDITVENLKRGEMCPHQGLFTSRTLMQEGFDTEYRIAADYEFLLRNIMLGENYCMMDIDVAYYSVFGTSADRALYDEYIAIIKKYAGEEYLGRIYAMRENDLDKHPLRRSIKKTLVRLLGEKNYLCLRGWKIFDGTL